MPRAARVGDRIEGGCKHDVLAVTPGGPPVPVVPMVDHSFSGTIVDTVTKAQLQSTVYINGKVAATVGCRAMAMHLPPAEKVVPNGFTGWVPKPSPDPIPAFCPQDQAYITIGSKTVFVNGQHLAMEGGGLAKSCGSVSGDNCEIIINGECTVEVGDERSQPPRLPALRQAYVNEVAALADEAEAMLAAGASEEETARAVHADRRALGEKYKALTPKAKLEEIYQRNLAKYGDKLGPTVDYLRGKGKSWSDIIKSASRAGGKDLGF